MKIIKDYSDYKIVNINNQYKYTTISLSFYISKKIPSTSIGIYLNLNQFFVEEYIYNKYNELISIATNFNVSNKGNFYLVNYKIKFENKEEYKHLQMLRDYIFLSILGVEDNSILTNNYLLNINQFRHRLNLLFTNETNFIQEVMLKHQSVNQKGLNEQSINILKNYSSKQVIKQYIKARIDFYNYTFKKDLIVNTSFSNYSGFYDSIFNKIFATYHFEKLDNSNVKLQAIEKLRKNEIYGQIYSNICDNALLLNIANYILIDALNLFLKWQKCQNKLVKLDNNSFINPNVLTKVQLIKFNIFYKQFVINTLQQYQKIQNQEIINCIKTFNYENILFIANYSGLSADTFEQTLLNIQNYIKEIKYEDVLNCLKYKTI